MYALKIKRIVDIFGSILLLLILSPLLLTVYGLLFFFKESPIFKQERIGYKGQKFYLYKFRSMSEEKDNSGNYLPDHKRLTRFGRFLRKFSIDELPGLVNVLRGEMSLIGPRPQMEVHLSRCSQEVAKRLDVLPGITGWAQVNGRNRISWKEKFEHDVWYVENMSFMLDLKIVILTIYKVIAGSDIYSSDF